MIFLCELSLCSTKVKIKPNVRKKEKNTDLPNKCKHSSSEKEKLYFYLEPLCYSGVVHVVRCFFSSFECVLFYLRRRVVLLGAKLKHFDLQIAIDYNTITARTATAATTTITRITRSIHRSTYQFEQRDIN